MNVVLFLFVHFSLDFHLFSQIIVVNILIVELFFLCRITLKTRLFHICFPRSHYRPFCTSTSH